MKKQIKPACPQPLHQPASTSEIKESADTFLRLTARAAEVLGMLNNALETNQNAEKELAGLREEFKRFEPMMAKLTAALQ